MPKSKYNIEYNKLIVLFMGGNIDNLDFYGDFSGCKYHSSWDWLMPAVEKYNKEYRINLLYSKNCFDILSLYKSLGSQLTLRKNHEALETSN